MMEEVRHGLTRIPLDGLLWRGKKKNRAHLFI